MGIDDEEIAMDKGTLPTGKGILVAIPDEWRIHVYNFLNSKSLKILDAHMYDKAVEMVRSEPLQGIIVVSEWLISDAEETTDLLKSIPQDVPVVMLARTGGSYAYMKVYDPPLREHCTIPFSLEGELEHFMQRTGMIG